MGLFGDDSNAAQSYNNYQTAPKHETHVTHELLGGAVAYEAAQAYEKHVAANGKPDSHAKAKEIAAGLIGGILEGQIEKHGLNYIDKRKAQRHAEDHIDEVIVNQY